MVKTYVATLSLLVLSTLALAQSAHKSLRNGDEEYDLEHYKEAEQHYRSATELKHDDPAAVYNLGNSFYQQGNWEDAAKRFEQATRTAPDDTFKADALHNLGNAVLKQHKYKEAVDAYEKSLRLRPGDAETKQNLQMAKKKWKEEQQRQQQEKQQKQQQNQEQPPQDQQDQQQNQAQQPNQGQSPNEQQATPPNQANQKENDGQQIKKEEAKRLLETAIGPEDQKNARKYREQRKQHKPSGKDKDW